MKKISNSKCQSSLFALSSKTKKQPVLLFIMIIVGFLTIFPFYLTIVNSLKYNLQITESIWFFDLPLHFNNYNLAFQEIWTGLINSIIITAGIIVGSLVISSLAAYSFARFDFPGKHLLYFGIIMFLMIPGFLTLLPQFLLVKDMGMINHYSGLTLPVIATASVMPVMFFRNYFEGLPDGLFEAAQIEGAGEFRIFVSIALPLSKSMIGTVAIMTGLQGWNNYIWPLIAATDRKIMPVVLMLQMISVNPLEGMGPRLAGYVIASIPLILLFAVATKPFIQGITAGAIKA